MEDKARKIIKIVIIVLATILVVESLVFGIKYYNDRKTYTFYTVQSSLVKDDKKTVAAGFSDYRHSDFNKFQGGYTKATLFVYEKDELIKEISLNKGYNGYYRDIIKTDDGYIAVGSIEMTKEQHDEKLSEGIIVKYDKNFKQQWRKNITILGKTEFYKIKEDNKGNYIVVGTSVYGQGYVGNHTTGGAILLKIDKEGKKLLTVNNGGPYTGKYNDVLIEDDGYVAVGLGKANSGIIVKYNTKGEKIWSSSYGYTNENGIVAIDKIKNNYVVAATKVVTPKNAENYSASIIKFNKNGKKIDDAKYTKDKITYFSDIKVKDDSIYVIGVTGKLINNSLKGDAIILKYDNDLYEEASNILKEDNNDIYNRIYIEKDKISVLGYSNSKIKKYKTNGYDYSPFIVTYNKNLK